MFSSVTSRLSLLELAVVGQETTTDGTIRVEHSLNKRTFDVSAAVVRTETNTRHLKPVRVDTLPRLLGDTEHLSSSSRSSSSSSSSSQPVGYELLSFIPLLRGASAIKINKKNLKMSPVLLFLSLDGATIADPGAICSRKSDGSCRSVWLLVSARS